jgi:hypothetical protein
MKLTIKCRRRAMTPSRLGLMRMQPSLMSTSAHQTMHKRRHTKCSPPPRQAPLELLHTQDIRKMADQAVNKDIAPSIDVKSLSYLFPDGSSGLKDVFLDLPPGSRTLLIGGEYQQLQFVDAAHATQPMAPARRRCSDCSLASAWRRRAPCPSRASTRSRWASRA